MARTAIVIGAGVIGVATAYALASRGWRVTLVDKANAPAMGTSQANGAQLSYCYTDALGSPATFADLPSLMLGRGGVSMRPFGGPVYLAWLAEFARNCTAGRFRMNTLSVLELGLESRDALDRFCDKHPIEFGRRIAGKMLLLHSDKERRRALNNRALKRTAADFEQIVVSRSELAGIDPALEVVADDICGAIHTPAEEVGDPFLFCAAMASILEQEYGVDLHFGEDVSSIVQTKPTARVKLANGEYLEADIAVVCSGIDSNRLLTPLGWRQPIQPMKGYSFEMPLSNGSPHTSVTDVKRRIVFAHLGDRIRVAGFAALGNSSTRIEAERIDELHRAARDCMPNAGDYSQIAKPWAGLRPATPNSQPVIRQVEKGLAINAGHGALGWTLAMGSGERLAKLLN